MKIFGRLREYLHGVNDAGTRLFRSTTHGLNEKIGRHRDRENKTECIVYGSGVRVCTCVVRVSSFYKL